MHVSCNHNTSSSFVTLQLKKKKKKNVKYRTSKTGKLIEIPKNLPSPGSKDTNAPFTAEEHYQQ